MDEAEKACHEIAQGKREARGTVKGFYLSDNEAKNLYSLLMTAPRYLLNNVNKSFIKRLGRYVKGE